ncbi:MAG: hypothetical protein SGPRY_013331 [Prymnesium sp.]
MAHTFSLLELMGSGMETFVDSSTRVILPWLLLFKVKGWVGTTLSSHVQVAEADGERVALAPQLPGQQELGRVEGVSVLVDGERGSQQLSVSLTDVGNEQYCLRMQERLADVGVDAPTAERQIECLLRDARRGDVLRGKPSALPDGRLLPPLVKDASTALQLAADIVHKSAWRFGHSQNEEQADHAPPIQPSHQSRTLQPPQPSALLSLHPSIVRPTPLDSRLLDVLHVAYLCELPQWEELAARFTTLNDSQLQAALRGLPATHEHGLSLFHLMWYTTSSRDLKHACNVSAWVASMEVMCWALTHRHKPQLNSPFILALTLPCPDHNVHPTLTKNLLSSHRPCSYEASMARAFADEHVEQQESTPADGEEWDVVMSEDHES